MRLEFSSGLAFSMLLDKILLSIMWAWIQQNLIDCLIQKIPGCYYYLLGFPQMRCLLLSIWNLRTLDTLLGLFWASSNAIMSHVWKNHRMSLRSPLLQWKSAHMYIFGSRLSQWFRLQLTQISSGLKVAKFYVDGSGLCGLCTDPVFSKLHLHRFVLSVLFSWAPKSSITQKTES